MAIVKAKPTSAGRRGVVQIVDRTLHKGRPHEALVEKKTKAGGRNNAGRITTRHAAVVTSSATAVIDFKRNKDGVNGVVERVEYDPNRSAHIALLLYADGERRYIIAPNGVQAGRRFESGRDAPIKPGNALPLSQHPGRYRGALHRAAPRQGRANGAQRRHLGADRGARRCARHPAPALRRDAQGARRVPRHDRRGQQRRTLAAQARQGRREALARDVRPTVRGVVMNPVDHPHGGGEGRTSGGRHPVALGRADQGLQNPQEQAHRPR